MLPDCLFFSKVYDHLAQAGVTNIAYPISSSERSRYYVDSEGVGWELATWINGKSASDLGSGMTEEDVTRIAQTLSSFHNATSSFRPGDDAVWDKDACSVWIPEMIDRRSKAMNWVHQTNHLGVDEINELNISTDLLIKHLAYPVNMEKLGSKNLPKNVIHADLNLDHIIKKDEDFCLIDFDRMRIGQRIIDIERLISEFSLINEKYVPTFIKEYTRSVDLTDIEIEVMSLFCAYQATRRAYWRIARIIGSGSDSESDWNKLGNEIQNATIMQNKFYSEQ